LNEVQGQFGYSGLTVLGVTSEDAEKTVPWIEKKGAEYPYAYDRGGKLSSALGVRGIPAAFLVDAGGRVIWSGHPMSLSEGDIEEALDGAADAMARDWPKSATSVKKALKKGDYAKAIEAAKGLAEEDELGADLVAKLRGLVQRRVAACEGAFESGDVLVAYEAGKAIVKGLDGLDEGTRVEAILEQIAKDKELKARLKTLEKLREICGEEVRRQKDCDEVIAALEKLGKGKDGTYEGDRIAAAVERFTKLRATFSR
jgi:hypothetical protein